jgi:DNA replication protein DnaC
MDSLEQLYLNKALIPERYLEDVKLRPSAEDQEAFEDLNNFKQNIVTNVKEGRNLLIFSNFVGNGKTSWATKILKYYISRVGQSYFETQPALFVNVTNLLNEKRLAISNSQLLIQLNKLEELILKVPLVVFDDLGVKDLSAYDLNNLYYWIDYRTANKKSCIYTSNIEPAQLATMLDPRLYDRIVNYSKHIQIKGGSNRAC